MTVPRVHTLGDAAVTIELGNERSPDMLRQIRAAAAQIKSADLEHVQDVVPAYLALTVFYDPLRTSFAEMSKQVLDVLARRGDSRQSEVGAHHIIPVHYNG